jgi:hypothetical protein
MNRTLIAIFIIVLVISMLFAPGQAVGIGIAIPLVGAIVGLLHKVLRRGTKEAEEKARQRQAVTLARKQKTLLEEESRKKAEETALKNVEDLESARQESRVKALAEATRRERKLACLQYAIEHLLVDCLLVDSKMWMSDEYGGFFYVLEQACREKIGHTLVMDDLQFDEICGIGRSSEDAGNQNHHARLAIERIEQFQKKGLLTISSAALNTEPALAGEPLVIRQIDAAAKVGKAITVVTADRDLRIRVRKYLYKSRNAKIEIVNIELIIQDCRDVQAADQSFTAGDITLPEPSDQE